MVGRVGCAILMLTVIGSPARASVCDEIPYRLLNGTFADPAQTLESFSNTSRCSLGITTAEPDISDADAAPSWVPSANSADETEQTAPIVFSPMGLIAGTSWRTNEEERYVTKFDAINDGDWRYRADQVARP